MADTNYKMVGLKNDKGLLGNYSMADGGGYIFPLGKLNIFIGTNNSGKSRLLRGILMTEKPTYLPSTFDYPEIQKQASALKRKVTEILDFSPFVEIHPNGGQPLIKSFNAINPTAGFGEEPNLIISLLEFVQNVQALSQKGHSSTTSSLAKSGIVRYHDARQVGQQIHQIVLGEFKAFIDSITTETPRPENFERLYVPILRGLRPPLEVGADIYHSRTTRDYFTKADNSGVQYPHIHIFTGLGIYSAIQDRLLGSLAERTLVQKYEAYLSTKFFEGKRVTLIPRKGHDVPTIKIGNEIEKEIFNVGDGIQSLIAITFPIFEHSELRSDKQLLACIEEPELLMHPGLQRTLMSELLTSPRYKNIQFFVATHSNHFLDLTLDYNDVSIFKVRKELDIENEDEEEVAPQFVIENISNKDKQTLELLGVKNSSVFLSNATIWVEGITDRMYLRKAFALWQEQNKKEKKKVFKEDAHYSFVEYGGANLLHWDFIEEEEISQMSLDSIVSNIFLIVDNDRDEEDITKKKKTAKEKRLAAIKKKMGSNFYRLQKREIENLLSPKVVMAVAQKRKATKGLTEEIKQRDYADARMGTYLEDTFGLKLADEYGAIRNKRKFAEDALEHIKSLEDLSPEMLSLCKKIEEFISKANEI